MIHTFIITDKNSRAILDSVGSLIIIAFILTLLSGLNELLGVLAIVLLISAGTWMFIFFIRYIQ
mgnify:FL=1